MGEVYPRISTSIKHMEVVSPYLGIDRYYSFSSRTPTDLVLEIVVKADLGGPVCELGPMQEAYLCDAISMAVRSILFAGQAQANAAINHQGDVT